MNTFTVGKCIKSRDEHIFDICNRKLWNSILSEIRCIDGRDSFRNELQTYLISNQKNVTR